VARLLITTERTVADIAGELTVSPQLVSKIWDAARDALGIERADNADGVLVPPGKAAARAATPPLTVMERRVRAQRAVEAVRSGKTLWQAASESGLSRDTVRKICRARGMTLGGRRDPSADAVRAKRDAQILAACRKTPVREVAERFGLTVQAVADIRARHRAKVLANNPVHAKSIAARKALRERLGGDFGPILQRLMEQGRGDTAIRVAALLFRTDKTLEEIGRKCGVRMKRVRDVWESVSGGHTTHLDSRRKGGGPTRKRLARSERRIRSAVLSHLV
jgi:hypothetical protein